MHFVEQWLLDRMVDGRPALRRLLLSPENPEDRLEYGKWAIVAGITPDRVRGGLRDLLRKGHIDAFLLRGEAEQPLAFDDLEALLGGSAAIPPEDVCFGMTPAGGRRYERYTFMDWRQYDSRCRVDCNESDDEVYVGRWQIEAGSWQRILGVLANAATKTGSIPDVGGLEIAVLSPWEATYWKTLPRGYRCEVGFWRVTRLSRDQIETLEHGLIEEFDRLYATFRAADDA